MQWCTKTFYVTFLCIFCTKQDNKMCMYYIFAYFNVENRYYHAGKYMNNVVVRKSYILEWINGIKELIRCLALGSIREYIRQARSIEIEPELWVRKGSWAKVRKWTHKIVKKSIKKLGSFEISRKPQIITKLRVSTINTEIIINPAIATKLVAITCRINKRVIKIKKSLIYRRQYPRS